jgi:Flp pilus assembly protein TadD
VIRRRRFSRRRLDRWLRGDLALGALCRLKTRDCDDLTVQAYRRLDAGDFAGAQRLFELLGQLWPGAATTATLGQGVCAQRQGDLASAEHAYDRVLDAEPKNLYALANRAEVKILTDRKEAASADLDSALASLADVKVDGALRVRIEKLKSLAL